MEIRLFSNHLKKSEETLTNEEKKTLNQRIVKYNEHLDEISKNIYEKLTIEDQSRFLTWFMKRWLSIDTVSSHEKNEYYANLDKITSQKTKKIQINQKDYHILDLSEAGLTGELTTYTWNFCIHDYHYRQYSNKNINLPENSTIIDAGAFVGDTALLFSQTYKNPTIHSFELLDENIELLNLNIKSNDIKNASVFKTALSNIDNEVVYINSPAIQGATSIFGKESGEPITTTTIDQHVKNKKLSKVDFIKMDIEGAERNALKGAKKTIEEHKPALAICLYHLWDDVVEIPKIINSINPNYKLSFNWVEIKNGWEAVLFAYE